MPVSATTLKKLMDAGISGDDLIDIVESIDNDMDCVGETAKPAPRSKAAERQARYRERQKASQTVTKRNDVTSRDEIVTDSETTPPSPPLSPTPPITPPITPPQSSTAGDLPLEIRREDQAFDLFVAAANRQPCWSVPEKLTKPRRSALAGRLREHGGLRGWEKLIARAEASQFLTGQSKSPFNLGFDWFVKAANLLKVSEGNYDDRTASQTGTAGSDGRSSFTRSNGGKLGTFERFDQRMEAAASGQEPRFNDERAGGEGYTIDAEATRLAG
jgi:hypothetical protein